MKFKYASLIILLISLSFLNSCCDCKDKQDEGKQIVPIVGKMSWSEWQQNAGWKDYDAKNYIIDAEKIKKIKSLLNNKNIEFIVFSGNWCSDSESEVPKFYKLINEINFSHENIRLYGVDRNKKEPTGSAQKYKIEKIPTLIVFKNGNEIGRIIEFPIVSWEEDLLTIMNEKQDNQ